MKVKVYVEENGQPMSRSTHHIEEFELVREERGPYSDMIILVGSFGWPIYEHEGVADEHVGKRGWYIGREQILP